MKTKQPPAAHIGVVKSLTVQPASAELLETGDVPSAKESRFTMADAARLTAESAAWPVPATLGVIESVLGREFWHWHNDTFNAHGATVLTQIHRFGQQQSAAIAVRAAMAANGYRSESC